MLDGSDPTIPAEIRTDPLFLGSAIADNCPDALPRSCQDAYEAMQSAQVAVEDRQRVFSQGCLELGCDGEPAGVGSIEERFAEFSVTCGWRDSGLLSEDQWTQLLSDDGPGGIPPVARTPAIREGVLRIAFGPWLVAETHYHLVADFADDERDLMRQLFRPAVERLLEPPPFDELPLHLFMRDTWTTTDGTAMLLRVNEDWTCALGIAGTDGQWVVGEEQGCSVDWEFDQLDNRSIRVEISRGAALDFNATSWLEIQQIDTGATWTRVGTGQLSPPPARRTVPPPSVTQ